MSALLLGLAVNLYIPIVILLLVIMGLSGNAWHGLAYTEIAVISGPEKTGTAIGMLGASVFISTFITPLIIAEILSISNWTIVWISIGLVTSLAYVIMPNQYAAKQISPEIQV